jgi:hypothetical protein
VKSDEDFRPNLDSAAAVFTVLLASDNLRFAVKLANNRLLGNVAAVLNLAGQVSGIPIYSSTITSGFDTWARSHYRYSTKGD